MIMSQRVGAREPAPTMQRHFDMDTLSRWETRFVEFLDSQLSPATAAAGDAAARDAAHDHAHVRRVVANARRLAAAEGADLTVVLPAAWLHDCVVVPKDSPQRSMASRLAAAAAVDFLESAAYPPAHIPAIRHAIEAHSFSAGIPPQTLEARVVQDADRLDSLGAIGIARTFIVGGALGREIYDEREPFPQTRTPDDGHNSVDHFYTKLFRLAERMNTAAGRAEAERRTAYMRDFLAQLGREIDGEGLP